MPTRREIIARIETPLTALYGEREARQIARIIVMELGGLCLTDLVAEPDKELGINELDRIIGELAAGRPLQYVLGHTPPTPRRRTPVWPTSAARSCAWPLNSSSWRASVFPP